MSRAKKSPFVFPSDHFSEDEDIKQVLHAAGFSEADQEWLIQVFKHPDCFGDSSDISVFRDDFTDNFEYVLPSIVEKLGEPVQTEKDRQTRLALLFSFLLNLGPRFSEVVRPKASNDSSGQSEWIGEFQSHAKFCAKSLDWDKLIELRNSNSVMFLFDDLVPILFPKGMPLDQIVDLDQLNPIRRRNRSSNDFPDPQQLEFWLIWRFNANAERCSTIRLDTLLQPFSDFSEDVLGYKILGLSNAIYDAMSVIPRSVRLDPLNDGWRIVAHELIPFLELLTAKEPDLSQERSASLKAWWHLARVIYGWSMGGLESDLSAELRNRLVESTARHIGILRSVLRDIPEVFEDKDSTGTVFDSYKEAFYVLLTLATPWKCLKPLLLAFTEMAKQAVTSDLRPWPESGREPPPHPYSLIPLWIGVAMYPQNLRNEMDRDPYLQDLREEFAKFCLERLKTKKKREASSADKQSCTNEDFVEPRPAWRLGYVQALTALRVNPGGRAHKTLFWLSQNDPDEMVRTLAKRAHKQIRHLDRKKPNLDVGASPRRPLFEAFWWLRQAHLLHLDVTPDPAGTMRTRRRELHRTQEKDDRRNWGRSK